MITWKWFTLHSGVVSQEKSTMNVASMLRSQTGWNQSSGINLSAVNMSYNNHWRIATEQKSLLQRPEQKVQRRAQQIQQRIAQDSNGD